MLRKLMQTDDDAGMLIVRVFLGLVMFPHGAQKLLGWFGGGGFAATLQGMTSMGLPAVIVLLVMVGAILTVHIHNGFFMNWMGNQKGEGFEYHLLAIGMAVAVMVKGSGRLS